MIKTNPFKFGSVVDEPYFTNRIKELKQIELVLRSANHLILISPRRYGKTSLILKVVKSLDRPYLFLDLQLITDVKDFAVQLLRRIYRIYPFERLKQLVKNFRIVPMLTLNPMNNEIEIGFQPAESDMPILEDVFNILEKLGEKRQRPIVVLDEFQEIRRIDGNLDRKLRSFIQHHQNVNYVFLGSLEGMMREIFENKKSPFYHFGQLLSLDKIPYQEFKAYLIKGFSDHCENSSLLAENILSITDCHPYYTQQLAFIVWNNCTDDSSGENAVSDAVDYLVKIHDMDYERLWNNLNQTDKKIMIALSENEKNILNESFARKYGIRAVSTVFSSIKRLMAQGYVVKKNNSYELDDIFFAVWIVKRRNGLTE